MTKTKKRRLKALRKRGYKNTIADRAVNQIRVLESWSESYGVRYGMSTGVFMDGVPVMVEGKDL